MSAGDGGCTTEGVENDGNTKHAILISREEMRERGGEGLKTIFFRQKSDMMSEGNDGDRTRNIV
eukprot:8506249-Pyramimonas_sp.AAC.1